MNDNKIKIVELLKKVRKWEDPYKDLEGIFVRKCSICHSKLISKEEIKRGICDTCYYN